MKTKKTQLILAACLFIFSCVPVLAATIVKGDPVQVITSERESIVGKLNSAIDAERIEIIGQEETVEVDQDVIVEIRLLKDDAKTQWRNEVALSGTRGSIDATTELASFYVNFFTERDMRTSSGFTSFAQVVLDEIHPTATFKSLRVNQVMITYLAGRPQTYENIRQIDLRITLNWDGWIQKNGYTQVSIIWDAEVERWRNLRVISSSGMDHQEAAQTTGAAIGIGLGLLHWLFSD